MEAWEGRSWLEDGAQGSQKEPEGPGLTGSTSCHVDPSRRCSGLLGDMNAGGVRGCCGSWEMWTEASMGVDPLGAGGWPVFSLRAFPKN